MPRLKDTPPWVLENIPLNDTITLSISEVRCVRAWTVTAGKD